MTSPTVTDNCTAPPGPGAPAERWADVPGYEGSYEVSTFGRVRSIERYVEHCDGRTRRLRGVLLKVTDSAVTLSAHGVVRWHSVPALVRAVFGGDAR